MSYIGAVRAPQPIPDPNLLQPQTGQRQTEAIFFLRAAPPAFIVLNVGGNNSNMNMAFQAASVPALPLPPSLLASRFYTGTRPSGLTITFEATIAGVGTVTAANSVTKSLAASIAGVGTVTGNFVRTLRSLVASIAGQGSVVADLSGGTLAGGLELTAEDSSSETLTAENSTGLTLTAEDSDTHTLTPA